MNLAEFSRTPFLQNTSIRLLLEIGFFLQNCRSPNFQRAETVVRRYVLENRCLYKNFAIFTGKTPVLESNFNKVATIKKKLRHRCFPVKFAKFLRTPFYYRTFPVAASERVFKTALFYVKLLA